MKKALIVAHTASHVHNFLMQDIKLLQELGISVSVVANFSMPGSINKETVASYQKELEDIDVKWFDLPFDRSPLSLSNLGVLKSLYTLIKKERYDIVHSHTPVGGALGRIAAKLNKVKNIIYTAHGFHFFKGGSLSAWLIFYPIEKIMSYLTDTIITINKEDFELATSRFSAKKVFKISGVGIYTDKVTSQLSKRNILRKSLGLSDDDLVILSVGEINSNKNHIAIVDALKYIENSKIKYLIVGTGDKIESLNSAIENNQLGEKVVILGYRRDIENIYPVADIFCFPSKREGLGLAAIEAMACGMPILTSNIGGINDYSIHGITGFKYDPTDVKGFGEGINRLQNKFLREKMGKENTERAKKYDVSNVRKEMLSIYTQIID